MQNYQLYADAMSNYLVLRCPEDGKENYQYRMLAVNRIPGLLSCSARVIDGESFLYYCITSKQSLARKYEHCFVSEEQLKAFLYAAAAMVKSLSEFLLDTAKIIMDPEYIFYDDAREQYCFTYFPWMDRDNQQCALFEYLAERIDPADEIARIVAFRLCELSERDGFVLSAELLDHEYSMARGTTDPEQEECTKEKKEQKKENLADNEKSAQLKAGRDEWEELEEQEVLQKCGKKIREKKGMPPIGILLISLLFGCASAGLFAIRMLVKLTQEELFAVRAGIIFSLGMTMITAIYGIICSWRKAKQDIAAAEQIKDAQRKNAMTPAMEYGDSNSVCYDKKQVLQDCEAHRREK